MSNELSMHRSEGASPPTRARSRWRASVCLSMTLCVSACGSLPASDPWRSEDISVPVTDDDGSVVRLAGLVCRPATDAPAPIVVINHGSPPSASRRPDETVASCDDEAPTWFLDRGYVVVQVLRRGYGATGGRWAESYGGCGVADYYDAGLETARDIAATVRVARTLPFARSTGAVVVGQSAGAWGVLAYSSQRHPEVAAMIAFAPGRGGHHDGEPDANCHPEHLAEAAGRYGAASRAGVLWFNAANDTYFDPSLVSAMQQSFVESGGILTAAHVGPFDDEGHKLFFGDGGSTVWAPIVAAYLREHGALSPGAPDGKSSS